jgi:hypothetical protein
MTAELHLVLQLLNSFLVDRRIALVIEFFVVLGAMAAACAFPRLGERWFKGIESWFGGLARRRTLAVCVVGLVALAARAALLPVEPIPQPEVHDEFSYLLAADTFANGRLTNPSHPLWEHFETLHVLQEPTYMSMFYPAQGLALAAGQVLMGHPFWGVWLSVGVMCSAICWMLQGWLPAGWALLGGFLAVFRIALFSYWGGNEHALRFSYWDNSYWGGAVAAIGGALVLGAFPRLRRCPRVREALLLGLGLAILANSRPFEGLFLGLGVAALAVFWMRGENRPPLRTMVRRVALPVFAVLALTLSAMGYYYWRVTGSPLRSPYMAVTETYDPIPYFPWEAMKAIPQYHNQVMKDYYLGWQYSGYSFSRQRPVLLAFQKLLTMVTFFFGPLLGLPIFALLAVKQRKFFSGSAKPGKVRLLLIFCGFTMVGMALPFWFNPHYAAPLTGAFFALTMLAMRHLWFWQWRGRPVGRQLVRAVPVAAVVLMVLQTSLQCSQWGTASPPEVDFVRERVGILAKLNRYPDQQLVVVHYALQHDPLSEWVYNRADIDAAKVVWTRDMGPSSNQELIRYFKDRRVWLLRADENPPQLLPYVGTEGTGAASAGHNPPSSQMTGFKDLRTAK